MRKSVILSFVLVLLVSLVTAQPVTITPPSANIDPGGSVTLTATGATYYQWSPATGLSTTEGPVTVASPMVTTTYTCEGFAPGAESVINSTFDQGNIGFSSVYTYSTDLFPEGTYCVGPNATEFHHDFIGFGHGGSGNFMVINGSTTPGTNVWTENITVNPNTYYAFSTWVCTVSAAGDMARLQFSINGNQLGDVFTAPSSTGQWLQFYELWYSSNTTEATITILNQNTSGSGNDFGLDDISFRELVLVGDPTCTVYVGSMSATVEADENELCEGGHTTLHALPVNGSGNYTFSWTPANTLDDPTSQHPVATPEVGNTTYTCLITDVDWHHSEEVDLSITVHPNKVKNIDEAICAYETFSMSGQEFDSTGRYEIHLQTQYNCDSLVILNLTVYPDNDTLLVDPSICYGDSYDFHGTIYHQDGQVAYFDTIDNHGCRKVEMLVLSVDEYQMPPILHQYECYPHGTSPSWYWDKTQITYHRDTDDEIVLDDPAGGCPIKHRLELRFHEEYYHEDTVSACSEYYWPITGETYSESQIGLTRTFQHSFGEVDCDSTYVLNLSIDNYEPNPTEIYPLDFTNQAPHWVVTSTEFQIQSYDFHIEDHNPNSVWDSVEWSFVEPIQWVLEPFDEKHKSCKVYVLNYIEDTIWLEARVHNQCISDEGVTRRYWLVCSFYGTEEDATVDQHPDFSVAPNPNNGQMSLVFNRMTGKVEMKVYDMTGNLIDVFQTIIDPDSNSVYYDMTNRPSGIYLFKATSREGVVTKKVIVR